MFPHGLWEAAMQCERAAINCEGGRTRDTALVRPCGGLGRGHPSANHGCASGTRYGRVSGLVGLFCVVWVRTDMGSTEPRSYLLLGDRRIGGREPPGDSAVDGGDTGLYWILPSQPTRYNPVGKPSTGCGTPRQRYNANARITGREAHPNDGSNANATMIYSNTHDDPKAHTHIPSETRRRTCTIPTPWRYHRGTGAQRATVSGPGL